MMLRRMSKGNGEAGFSLIEMMVALLVTLIVMMAVFALLQRGQDSFRREPEVADMNQSARVGLNLISTDLVKAGYETPPAMAIMWVDGGGITPDQLSIVYADENVPTSEPIKCGGLTPKASLDPYDAPPFWMSFDGIKGYFSRVILGNLLPIAYAGAPPPVGGGGGGGGGGPCRTIDRSSVLNIDPDTFTPPQVDPEQAYHEGQVLFALETWDCDGDGQLGIVPFEVTKPPQMNNAGGEWNLQVIHNPGGSETGLNPPGGFNYQVHPDCAVIGLFHVIQYRINPLPPAANPMLERRDLAVDATWVPVSNNIENLQLQYAEGNADVFFDDPPRPLHTDPTTWITRVKVTVFGRSESRNLQGATAGVFAAEDTQLRNAFSTTQSLRNQVFAAARESDNANWN